MGAVVALGSRRTAKRGPAKRKSTVAARSTEDDRQGPAGCLPELVALAEQLLRQPEPQQVAVLVQRLQAFAAGELRRGAVLSAPAVRAFVKVADAGESLRAGAEKQLRWAADAAASLLLTYSVSLQPAVAADAVNYSPRKDLVEPPKLTSHCTGIYFACPTFPKTSQT